MVTLTGWKGDFSAPWPQVAFSTAALTALMVSGQSLFGEPPGPVSGVGAVGVRLGAVEVGAGWAAGALSDPQAAVAPSTARRIDGPMRPRFRITALMTRSLLLPATEPSWSTDISPVAPPMSRHVTTLCLSGHKPATQLTVARTTRNGMICGHSEEGRTWAGRRMPRNLLAGSARSGRWARTGLAGSSRATRRKR